MSEKGTIFVGGNVFRTLSALEKLGGEAELEKIEAFLNKQDIYPTNLRVILWRLGQAGYVSRESEEAKIYALTAKGVTAMERAIDQLTKAFY